MGTLEDQEPRLSAESPEMLRFACRHCAVELTAPLSAAEVEGPCPVCGGTIQAPPGRSTDPIPVTKSEPKEVDPWEAAGLPITDRLGVSPLPESAQVPAPSTSEGRMERRKVRKRRKTAGTEDFGDHLLEAEGRMERRKVRKRRKKAVTEDSGDQSLVAEERMKRRKVRKRRKTAGTEDFGDHSLVAEERREARALLKLVCAILATLAIVLVVTWVVRNGVTKPRDTPDSEDSRIP